MTDPTLREAERAPALLDGDTAWGLTRLGVAGLAGGAAAALLLWLAAFLPEELSEALSYAALAAGVCFGLLAIWAGAGTLSAIDRERDAGYTTLYGRYRELWQLDHRTGEVLRRPGEREVRRRPRDEA